MTVVQTIEAAEAAKRAVESVINEFRRDTGLELEIIRTATMDSPSIKFVGAVK